MTHYLGIIGTGIAALRAGLEVAKDPECAVSFFEKARSVGGRVATRRFGQGYVNHGAPEFGHWGEVLRDDEGATGFDQFVAEEGRFKQEATALPKAMKESILASSEAEFHFEAKVQQVKEVGEKVELTYTQGEKELKLLFDRVLITAPLPQVEELLGFSLQQPIQYRKKILLIGFDHLKKNSVRLELPEAVSEEIFDLEEGKMLERVQKELGQAIVGFDVKKWRYSQVGQGVPLSCLKVSERIWVAGDAFDVKGYFDASSAWYSGLSAAKEILETLP